MWGVPFAHTECAVRVKRNWVPSLYIIPLKKIHGHEHAKGSDPVVSRVTRGGKR